MVFTLKDGPVKWQSLRHNLGHTKKGAYLLHQVRKNLVKLMVVPKEAQDSETKISCNWMKSKEPANPWKWNTVHSGRKFVIQSFPGFNKLYELRQVGTLQNHLIFVSFQNFFTHYSTDFKTKFLLKMLFYERIANPV